ncbi:MAG: type II secretion system protein GspL [Sandaracinaceae bacterium]|nr:type II secretion system protein GspL [Sandaracinaceae bacterium]
MATEVALVFDSLSLRAALVQTRLGKAKSIRYVELPLGKKEGEGALPSAAALAQASSELLRIAGPHARLIAAMPGTEVSLRLFEFPKSAARKLEELLPFELEGALPFELENVLIDHQLAPPRRPETIRVLACAVLKERLRQWLDFLQSGAMNPMHLIPSHIALGGLASFVPEISASREAILVVVVEPERIEIGIIRESRLERARSFARFNGGSESDWLSGQGGKLFLAELKQTLLNHAIESESEPSKVLLGGVIDEIEKWVEALEATLGLPVALLELPSPIGLDGRPDPLFDSVRKARFALPLALAGHPLLRPRGVELRRGEFLPARQESLGRALGLPMAIGALAVIFSWGFAVYAQYTWLRKQRESLKGTCPAC